MADPQHQEQSGNKVRLPRSPKTAPALLLPFMFGSLVAGLGLTAPVAASPDLEPAFDILDVDRSGELSRAEFVTPEAAHEVDLRGVQPGFDGPIAVAGLAESGAYVRFLLLGPTGDVPMLIAVDAPKVPADAAMVTQLVDQAFDRLDRDSSGGISPREFSGH